MYAYHRACVASAPASNTKMDGVQCTRIPPHVCIPQGASSELDAQGLERAVWFPVLVFIELISPTCMHDTGPVWLLLPHRTPTWMAFSALVSPHMYAYHRALQVNFMLKRWRGPCGFRCWCSLNLYPPHVCIPQGLCGFCSRIEHQHGWRSMHSYPPTCTHTTGRFK